jgi:hopene-associated glycosyltransferase HpnB
MTVLAWAGALGGAMWLALLALPWRPWSTRERLAPAQGAVPLRDVTVLIPARDEAAVLPRTLAALAEQGEGLEVIVIDDQSGDGTGDVARAAAAQVIDGAPRPAGWSGKLWALEQGRRQAARPLILLLDADIALAPGMLAALLAKRAESGAALVSIMATLSTAGFWQRLLVPAFVYFFKLLYPFALSNGSRTAIAAAAGGCILIERAALEAIGGFAALSGALIDDCALAAAIKRSGRRTWIGLGHGVVSHRVHAELAPIWAMVSRTAYTQLRHSPALLALCTALMALAFWAPLLALPALPTWPALVAALGLAAMLLSYQPMLRFYGHSPLWALALPLIGTLYLAMTWTSALASWRGKGARWKGRRYA